MIIKRMAATFGKLNAAELKLNDKLNVIRMPNESGKSTWCAFICAMLYGIDKSERERAGHKPDKIRYQPWDGSPMEGVMDIRSGTRDITLWRGGPSPMRKFTATLTGTNEPAGLSSEDAGEILTGVYRDVFERSAFVRQSGITVSGAPELQARIAAIVSGGDDEASFADIDNRLQSWLRSRRYNRRGSIPELEDSLALERDKLTALRKAEESRIEAQKLLDSAIAKRDKLQEEVTESRKRDRREALDRIAQAQAELHTIETDSANAQSELESHKQDMANGILGIRDPADTREQTHADADRAAQCIEISRDKGNAALPIIFAILTLASAAAGFLFLSAFLLPLLGLAAVLLIISAFTLGSLLKKKRSARQADAEYVEILKKYSAVSPDDILKVQERQEALWEAYLKSQDRVEDTCNMLDELRRRIADEDAKLLRDLDFTNGTGDSARLTRELNEAERELHAMRERMAMDVGRLEGLGDVKEIEKLVSELERRLAKLNREYEAIALAIATLGEANTEIQSRFSPKLSKRAGEIFHVLTGGRYEELTFDKELKAMARLTGDISPRESAFLSAGALDQLYLALRLAICELALPADDPCPLILDDALVNFDDERASLAMEYLRELSQTRQVILFTC